MSPFDSLSKEQQAYLLEFARQTFPSKSLHRQPATTKPQEDHIDFDSDHDIDTPGEWQSLCDDDGEGNRSCHSDEDSEKGDEYDEQIQVCSLEPS